MGNYSLKKEKPSHVGPAQTSKRRKQKLCSSFAENIIDGTDGRKYRDVFMRLKE